MTEVLLPLVLLSRRVINKNAQTSLSMPITKCETIYGSTTKKINNGLKQEDEDLKILNNILSEMPPRDQPWSFEPRIGSFPVKNY